MSSNDVGGFSPDSYTRLVTRLNKSNNSRALQHPLSTELLFKKGKLEGDEIDNTNVSPLFLTPYPRSCHPCHPCNPCRPPPACHPLPPCPLSPPCPPPPACPLPSSCHPRPPCYPLPEANSVLPGCPMPIYAGGPKPIPPEYSLSTQPQISACPPRFCCVPPQNVCPPEDQLKMMVKLKDSRTRDILELPPGYATALENPPVNTVEGIEAINRRVQQIKDMMDLMKLEKQRICMKNCPGCCCCCGCWCSEFPDLLETVNDNIVSTITNCK